MRGIDREENACPEKKGQIIRPEITWGRASQRNLSKSSDGTESLIKAEATSGQSRHVATDIQYHENILGCWYASRLNLRHALRSILLYNKSEFDAPEIHDVALKVWITVCMVRLNISAQLVCEYVFWIYLLSHERISYVQYVRQRFH